MEYNTARHHRTSVRLKNYNYPQSGAYFVTICTHNKVCLFGEIVKRKIILNDLGKIATQEWLRTPLFRPNISLDEYIIMPNHVHGIIVFRKLHTEIFNHSSNDDKLSS